MDYSLQNIQQIKQIANMALALNQDVIMAWKISASSSSRWFRPRMVRSSAAKPCCVGQFEGEDIPPSVFIPILEKENMIHLAGRWVFEKAVCSCTRIIAYDPDFYLTFNVSLHQLSDTQFIDFMHETLQKYRLGRLPSGGRTDRKLSG